MDVFLVPIGGDRYELYTESADEPASLDAGRQGRFWRALQERFDRTLAAIEREHGTAAPAPAPAAEGAPGLVARLTSSVLRWIAERVAEQRLLWRLRNQSQARLLFPDDLGPDRAREMVLAMLRRDRDRHRIWLVVNAAAFVASGVVAVIPGPNLIAYYFAFRAVGHYLSTRGAQHAASGLRWLPVPSRELASLRRLPHLADPDRERLVQDAAQQLHLRRLGRFLAMTVPSDRRAGTAGRT